MKTRIFTLIVSLFIATMAFAYDIEIDGIYYNLDNENKTAEVTYQYDWNPNNYSGVTNITIPSIISYDGTAYSVTSIGDEAFLHCLSLTSITIPNSVTSIGGYAFLYCSSLTSISIPNSVTSIGYKAFSETPWLNNQPDGCIYINNLLYTYKGEMPENTHIDVKEGTTIICNNAFNGCSSLTSITIPNSVTSIGYRTFFQCSSLTSITIPNSVTSIEEGAFYYCTSLISITIPNSVTSIGEIAFYHCTSLTSITIPNSVTYIGSAAFAGCPKLTNMVVESENRVYDSRDNCNAIIETASNTLIQGCKNTIIPNSVTSIGEIAFGECLSLTSINIPNSVISIEYAAFNGCSSLTLINIPNSVTSIGDEAFSHCKSLTSIIMQSATPPTIVEETFYEVSRGVEIRVPCGSINSYKTAEYWSEFTNYEEVPSTTITINVNDETMGFATVTKRNTCDDDVAQVQAQALAGYKFVRWSDGSTENPHIVLVTEDITLTAEFAKEGEEPGENPDVEKHNNFIVESADATQGSVIITITAQAIEGFEFSHWSDGSTENPRNVTLDKDVELYAHFQVKGTGLENSVISSANVYSRNGILHVEGAENDYYVLDMAGRLIYSGRDTELQLPRGVYVVNVGGEVQKVVL